STVTEPRTNYFTGRLLKASSDGATRGGLMATAVNRNLNDPGLSDLLRKQAYTGGVDFTHEFWNRTWSVEAFFASSWVGGSTAAMIRTQQHSSRYFQRPDAGHVHVDSTLTSLSGYSTRLEVGKRNGVHWTAEANVFATSPGFEINDIGFQ